MKSLLLIPLLLCGCARFKTIQIQNDTLDDAGKVLTRTTTTQVSATTFFEAKSALTAFKASQTDKTQSANVGSLTQEASSTNLNLFVESVIGAVIKAAVSSQIAP